VNGKGEEECGWQLISGRPGGNEENHDKLQAG